MNCFRFAVIHNTTIINIINSDDSDIAYSKTEHCQNMTAITYIILKIESMIKKPLVTNHTFFAIVNFSKIRYVTCMNSIVIQYL